MHAPLTSLPLPLPLIPPPFPSLPRRTLSPPCLRTIAWRVSPAAFSIFLSVGSSMVVFPFFTFSHSTGLMGERLAQVSGSGTFIPNPEPVL